MDEETHQLLGVSDHIATVGELEHIRNHAVRSAKIAKAPEDKLHYEIVALRSKEARREYQAKYLPSSELDWCLSKAAAHLKQLNYETVNEIDPLFTKIENLCDMIHSHAYGVDLSGCEACAKDMAQNVNSDLDK